VKNSAEEFLSQNVSVSCRGETVDLSLSQTASLANKVLAVF